MGKKRLGTWERSVLRRTYGPVGEQEIYVYRIRNNQELKELYEDADIEAGFKKKRL